MQSYHRHVCKGYGCNGCKNESQRLSLQEIISKLNHNKFIFFNLEDIDSKKDYRKTKIYSYCKDCGMINIKNLEQCIRNRNECKGCSNILQKNDLDDVLKTLKTGFQYPKFLEEYVDTTSSITVVCDKGHETYQKYSVHINTKCGCTKCNKSFKWTRKQILEKIKERNKFDEFEYLDIPDDLTTKSKLTARCKKCEHIFCPIVGGHISQETGCPVCSESKGERKIKEYLISMNIRFERQKRFKDCRDKHPLPFDFYLPDCNICIEFDGLQHFMALEKFGGEISLKMTQEHDRMKNEYCKNKNIILIRIKYNEDIENKLKFILVQN